MKEHRKKKENKGEENEIKNTDKDVIFRKKGKASSSTEERRKTGEDVDNIEDVIYDWWLPLSLWDRNLCHLLKMSGWIHLSDLRKNGKDFVTVIGMNKYGYLFEIKILDNPNNVILYSFEVV